MSDIAGLLTQNGLQPYLTYTKTLVARARSDGTLVEWNPAFEQAKKSLPPTTVLLDLLTDPSRQLFSELLHSALTSKEPGRGILKIFPGKEAGFFDCLILALPNDEFLFFAEPVSDPQTEIVAKLSQGLQKTQHALDIKKIELEAVLAQVDEIAHIDQLTFISNRRQIVGDLQRGVTACSENMKPLTILMLDIDHFKQVNDTFGHAAGDKVLQALARQLQESIRQSDHLGRYGGEEFLILLPDTQLKSALRLADRLLKAVRELSINIGNQEIHITLSIGIAQHAIDQESWDELLERADKALYQSKNNGRDQWTVLEFGNEAKNALASA